MADHDPEPQPTDGPEYHAEHAAWRERQAHRKCGTGWGNCPKSHYELRA